jgi:hypothetical protein
MWISDLIDYELGDLVVKSFSLPFMLDEIEELMEEVERIVDDIRVRYGGKRLKELEMEGNEEVRKELAKLLGYIRGRKLEMGMVG